MNVLKLISAEFFILFLVSLKGYSQSTEIYTDGRGNKYAAINAKGMLKYKVEDRSKNPTFRTRIQLFKYTSTGQNTEAEKDENGKDIYVYRTIRHTNLKTRGGACDWKIPSYFIISPDIVSSDGEAKAEKMAWATANGYLATANTNYHDTQSFAVAKGCAMYRGKDGRDEPGTWRVPTRGECALILIFYKKMEEDNAETDFKPFSLSSDTYTDYWIATEYSGYSNGGWNLRIFPNGQISGNALYSSSSIKKSGSCYLRCVRDIPSE